MASRRHTDTSGSRTAQSGPGTTCEGSCPPPPHLEVVLRLSRCLPSSVQKMRWAEEQPGHSDRKHLPHLQRGSCRQDRGGIRRAGGYGRGLKPFAVTAAPCREWASWVLIQTSQPARHTAEPRAGKPWRQKAEAGVGLGSAGSREVAFGGDRVSVLQDGLSSGSRWWYWLYNSVSMFSATG